MSLCPPVLTALAVLALAGCSQDSNVHLGAPCALGFDAGATQATYTADVPECASGLCLKPAIENYMDRGTGPYCTTTCSSDSDCHGERRDGNDRLDHRCISGYACAVAFAVGPLCCQKLCICKDFLDERGAVTPPNCQAGADGRNGCGIE